MTIKNLYKLLEAFIEEGKENEQVYIIDSNCSQDYFNRMLEEKPLTTVENWFPAKNGIELTP